MLFRAKIVTTVVLLQAIAILVVLWLSLGFLENRLQVEIGISNRNSINQLKQYGILDAVTTEDYGDLQYAFEDLVKKKVVDEMLLYDNNNNILASSNSLRIGKKFNANMIGKNWFVEKIVSASSNVASIAFHFNDDAIRAARKDALSFGFYLAVAGLLLVGAVGYAVGTWLSHRLVKIASVLDVKTLGDIESFDVDPSSDEIGQLSRFVHQSRKKIAKQMEELTSAEERMRLALQSAGAGAWKYDVKNGSVFWSAKIYQIFGMMPSDEGPSMKVWSSYVHPDDMPSLNEALAGLLERRENLCVEYRVIRRSGVVRWVRSVGRLFVDSNDEPREAFGMLFDISHEKSDYSVLEHEKNLLSTMLNLSEAHFVVVNIKNKVVAATQKAKELFDIDELNDQMSLSLIFSSQTIKDIECASKEKISVTLKNGAELPHFFTVNVFPYQDLEMASFSIISFHIFEAS